MSTSVAPRRSERGCRVLGAFLSFFMSEVLCNQPVLMFSCVLRTACVEHSSLSLYGRIEVLTVLQAAVDSIQEEIQGSS